MLAIFRISITILWPLCQGFVPFHNIVPNFVAPEHFAREPSFASSSSSKKRWAAMTEDDGVRAQHCHGRNTAMALNQEKMAARDLVAELKNKRAAVTSAAAEEPMNTAQIEEMETAAAHRELDACWFLNVSKEVQDAAVESGDLNNVECLQALTGTAFFDTGIAFNGQPLCKSTEEQMPLACSVYFCAVPTGTGTPGWCCGNHLFRSEKDKSRWDNACGLRTLCWAGGQHNVPNNGAEIKAAGADLELLSNAYCFELPRNGPRRAAHIEKNVAFVDRSEGLVAEVNGSERFISIGCGHTSQFCKVADVGGITCEEEGAEQHKGKAHGKSFFVTNDKQPKKVWNELDWNEL